LGKRGHSSRDIGSLATELAKSALPGDHVLIMSNGGFGGLHGKLLAELESKGRIKPGK
jgi:UDP-N-acetylmuramate: L-alanyl-gamma-D-glutamyl-meso-diaminopimelate ligase